MTQETVCQPSQFTPDIVKLYDQKHPEAKPTAPASKK